ncbi:predicted protein [Arabidopsis lyrata subsp. lyrata]|uniref:Predicted protein n=1 Tax=Arabidopsis lyrata subsp. lyrata TaxID=81972 RepID=D7LG76_ARALL|nr:predicted protein [Arabidopsis lyrata subsp. lyrata]
MTRSEQEAGEEACHRCNHGTQIIQERLGPALALIAFFFPIPQFLRLLCCFVILKLLSLFQETLHEHAAICKDMNKQLQKLVPPHDQQISRLLLEVLSQELVRIHCKALNLGVSRSIILEKSTLDISSSSPKIVEDESKLNLMMLVRSSSMDLYHRRILVNKERGAM